MEDALSSQNSKYRYLRLSGWSNENWFSREKNPSREVTCKNEGLHDPVFNTFLGYLVVTAKGIQEDTFPRLDSLKLNHLMMQNNNPITTLEIA